MKTIKIFALMAMVCVLLTGSAYAGQITQTFILPLTTTDITGTTGTGTFNFFQSAGAPSGAILSSVTLEMLIGDQIEALTVSNTAAQAQNFRFRATADLTAVGTAPSLAALQAAIPGGALLNLLDTGTLTYAFAETKTFAPPIIAKSADTGLVNGVVASYSGAGTFTLGFVTLTNEIFNGGGGNTADALTTRAQGTITVIYNYEEQTQNSPEPATMAMLGSALIGLGLIGRKRFAR